MFEWDKDPLPTLPKQPTPERLLQFLCTPGLASGVPDFKTRYRQISTGDNEMFMSLHEAEFVENLLWPLRHAKTSYLLGNFVGAIALCGIVAEKVAILIHALNTADEEERNTFEGLDQSVRVKQLKEGGLLKPEMMQEFGTIRAARKRYLHYWTPAQSRVAEDAVQSYAAALRLLLAATPITFEDGKANLAPQLVAYLQSRGVLQHDAEPGGAA
jgi:hypothetical protein